MNVILCIMLGAVLAIAAQASFAATRLEDLAVKPNPAVFAGGTPPRVEIAVTVNRSLSDRQPCDVKVEPGDGGSALQLTFGVDERTKSVPYVYKKPGSYQVKAVAGFGCSGSRSVSVAVQTTAEAASPAPSASVPAEPAALSGPGCPAGWWLVPESVQGGRYNCRPNLPARPLMCAGGTSYFAENGIIGCR